MAILAQVLWPERKRLLGSRLKIIVQDALVHILPELRVKWLTTSPNISGCYARIYHWTYIKALYYIQATLHIGCAFGTIVTCEDIELALREDSKISHC